MKFFQRSNVKKLSLLLLIPALALGPFGCCGAEAIPLIIAVATTAGVVAFTINQFQQIESAQLDNEMRRLRLRSMENGRLTTFEQPLSDAEYRDIRNSGKVSVNGVVIPVSR